jgi:hypothetical protein
MYMYIMKEVLEHSGLYVVDLNLILSE